MSNVQIEDILRLSPVQQSILNEVVVSGSTAETISQRAFRLHGLLNGPALLKAFRLLVEETPMLRASIQWEGMERPVAVVQPHVELPVRQENWSGEDELEIGARVKSLCRNEREAGFTLQKAPLLRPALVQTSESDFILLWTFHTLVLDRTSVGLLMEQLFQHYEDLVAGTQTQRSPQASLKAYIQWVTSQDTSRAEVFWREMLRDVPEDQMLRAAPRSSGVHNISSVQRELPGFLIGKNIENKDGFGLRALANAAWAVLLNYYFGAEHIVFGTNVDGRHGYATGTESICGPLGNLLPFLTRIPNRTPVEVWLDQLRAEWDQLNQYAFCGLDKIREWSGIPGERPLLETAVIIEGPPFFRQVRAASGDISIHEFPVMSANGPALTLQITGGHGLSLQLHYDENTFGHATMERLLTHAADLFQTLTDNPSQIPGRFQVLQDEERQLLLAWGRGPVENAPSASIHQAFERQAMTCPDRVAVVDEAESITYGQLNTRANQLAHHLRRLNIGPENAVGVYMTRSIETAVALLAVSKAGGIYLPLDPELPPERLKFLLRDAQPSILLTKQETLFDLASLGAGCEILCLDTESDLISSYPKENPSAQLDPTNSAYIIYTSGSTGKPKGVVVPQGAAAAHLRSIARAFEYRPEDRVLQFAGLSFDVSIEQLLAPLYSGSSLFLKPSGPWDTRHFFTAIQDRGITVANIPPGFWSQLVDNETSWMGSLRLVVVGGDVMFPETVRRWQGAGTKHVELLNAYGPTEAVITATLFKVPRDYSQDRQTRNVPIGTALPDRMAYVLNHLGELAPIGVWGELFLGGLIARGYLNQPALTAERFIPDAYAGSGARLYKTGDIARYHEGGLLEFMGRSDTQVKIRGFRIELSEVELAIAEHPDVSQAVVEARPRPDGDKRLIAYVVAKQARTIDIEKLREFVREKLPEYMVPSLMLSIDCFPLTASGKVDRNRLPGPGEAHGNEGSHAGSEGPVVTALREIWIQLLGVPQVGVNDDFFDLGGDSLLATQVISRVHKTLGIEIPLRVMFESPTIADLARAVEATVPSVGQPAFQHISRDQEIPLSPAQERLWFLSQAVGQSSVYNMTGAVRLEGDLDTVALERSLTEVVRRHEALRTVFPLSGDHPVQKVLPTFDIEPLPTDLSHLPEDQAVTQLHNVFLEEAAKPVDLAAGPVFRLHLIRLAPNSHVLLATLHHIAGDAWSLGILARDLNAAYAAISKGKEVDLPPLSYQYADFASWQRQLLDRTGEDHLAYWRKRLGGCPPPVPLPQEKRKAAPGLYGAAYSVLLPRALADGVRSLAQQSGSTLFMVLLAALNTLLSFYTGSDDIVVGTDIANRNRPETENVIGFFVNILALRTDLGGNPTFLELLSRVREVTLGAYQHQDLPYIRLIEELNPNRGSGEISLFKTFFYMPVAGLELLELCGLKVTVLDLEERTAKFDLSVKARETAEGLQCSFEYKTDLFDEGAIREIADGFQIVLQAALEKPEARLNWLRSRLESGQSPLGMSSAESRHGRSRAFAAGLR